jgi:hypothetical protein
VSAHLQLAITFLHSEERLWSTNKAQHHPTSNWIPSWLEMDGPTLLFK